MKKLLLLDYDGTLTDFTRSPEDSHLPPATFRLLNGLKKRHPVILISGRHLAGLKRVSGLKGFPMVGTHGFESQGLPGGLKLATYAEKKFYWREAANLFKALSLLKKTYPEIHIERKPFSSTLHYRGISYTPIQVKKLRKLFQQLFRAAVSIERWTLRDGKQMIEAMPKGFNKGKAVLKIIRHFPGYQIFYAGDDLTDVSAFKALGNKGTKIAIGTRIPRKYYDRHFDSPKSFVLWLKKISGPQ